LFFGIQLQHLAYVKARRVQRQWNSRITLISGSKISNGLIFSLDSSLTPYCRYMDCINSESLPCSCKTAAIN